MEISARHSTVHAARRRSRALWSVTAMVVAFAMPSARVLGQERVDVPTSIAPPAHPSGSGDGYVDPERSPRPAARPTRVTRAMVIDGHLAGAR